MPQRAIVGDCLSRRSGQLIYVRGEAGIGKTRLVEQMRLLSEAQGFATHRGLVLDFGVGKGQDPIRTLLLSVLGSSPAADAEARRRIAERLIAEAVVTPERMVFPTTFLSCRKPVNGAPCTTRWTMLRAIAASARSQPRSPAMPAGPDRPCSSSRICIGRIPRSSLHLAAIAAAIADGPGLLAMTSRVEGDPLDAAWRASCSGTPFATIDLGPLRQDEALSLAGGFIDTTQRVAIACVERAAGNPLFLGAAPAQRGGGQWRCRPRFDSELWCSHAWIV